MLSCDLRPCEETFVFRHAEGFSARYIRIVAKGKGWRSRTTKNPDGGSPIRYDLCPGHADRKLSVPKATS